MQAWRSFLAATALVFTLSACSQNLTSLAPLPQPTMQEYTLASGDEVRIFVYGLDAVNNTFTVNDKGALTLPLVGSIEAEGLTITGLENEISSKLIEKAIVNQPSVNVQPVQLRPFYILGEVRNPGQYTYQHNLSVLSAVSVAGGFTFRADEKKMSITRIVDGQRITGSADEATLVQPGDTIRIIEKWF